MGDKTGIEWTDATWNPLLGCEHISPGCDNCYAAREASGRLAHLPVYSGLAEGGKFTGEVRLVRERLDQPIRWRKPRMVFTNSMSDLFHRDVPDAFIAEVFRVMGEADRHIFQVLTKRPQRMREFVTRAARSEHGWLTHNGANPWTYNGDGEVLPTPWPPDNVWLGTSIESDRYSFRADHLRDTPAAVRFLSLEPLLGPLPSLNLDGIDWVIVGGESGPKARPMHPAWVTDLRDQAQAAGAAFFFKQWGEWGPAGRGDATHLINAGDGRHVDIDSATMKDPYGGGGGDQDLVDRGHEGWARIRRWGKKRAGRELGHGPDRREWSEMPNTDRAPAQAKLGDPAE